MKLRRPESVYAEGKTIKEALALIDRRATWLEGVADKGVRWLLILICFASAAGSVIEYLADAAGPLPGVVLGVAVVSLIANIFQAAGWVWPGSKIGKLDQIAKVGKFIAGPVQKAATGRVLARYGKAELAESLQLKRATAYSVASYVRRRRLVTASFAGLSAMAVVIAIVSHSQAPKTSLYTIGQTVSLDSGFSISVISPLHCGVEYPVGSNDGPLCSIEASFTNISNYPQLFGEGSLTTAGPQEVFTSTGYDYALSLRAGSRNYDFFDSMENGSYDPTPGETVTCELYFSVPAGIMPSVMVISSESNSSTHYISLARG